MGVFLSGTATHSAGFSRRERQNTLGPLAEQTSLPIRVPVLVLAYYPPDPNNPEYLDPVETGEPNHRMADVQAHVQGMVETSLPLINETTRYHGYEVPNAPMFLEYFISDRQEFFHPMPRGYHLGDTAYRPNYGQILRDLDICNYVDVQGVREVWIYGYHSDFIVPDESKMSSKYGDISNSYPKDEYIPEEYRLPRCTNSYVMYNFNYYRGVETNIHNRMHQIENVIFFAEDRGYPPNNTNVIGSVFWDDFSVYGNRASLPSYRASCGNTHAPPNVITGGHIYDSRDYHENNCETWHPDDSQTTYVSANCEQWGCTEVGFYKWFMQNMPGYNNGIVYNGKQMRNWWEAMYDFNQFIDAGRSLYVTSTSKVYLPLAMMNNYAPIAKPIFVYPVDGQTLDYAGDWLFKVEPMANAQGFLWGFFQNGEMVWENLRDEGQLSGNEYAILAGSEAHSRFLPGDVEVWIRASIGDQWTQATVITIHLAE